MIRRANPAMGTMVHVAADGPDAAAVAVAVSSACAAVAQVQRLMSFHDENSELSRLNRLAAQSPQVVHPWTYAVLRRARRVAELSEGLFDIGIAPALVRAGLLPDSLGRLPESGTWRDLCLLPNHHVAFAHPMLIDLGGIAKGYAVDHAIHILRRAGCTEAAVNAGGDLRRYGSTAELIHLRRGADLVPVAELRCGAIATSGPRDALPERLAQPIGCIVDPRTGKPWDGAGSVLVAARSCTLADALTKVAVLAGPACQPLLARFGAQAMWDGAI